MEDKGTSKKITHVQGGDSGTERRSTSSIMVTPETIARARQLRVFSILAWIAAIGFEGMAILWLRKIPVNMTMLIVFIVADLVLAVIANLMWKQSNRLDPASEKDQVRFFIQNQLGLIISVIAFLPLVILVFTNKNMSGKQKGIVGSLAAIALFIAGYTGTDFNPPSQEKYAQQTEQVKQLKGGLDDVYWTKSGKSYHLYKDCPYINGARTTEIFEGTVAQARELKNITDICDLCERRASKENSGQTQ
jgi:hypothetical protein